MSVSMGRCVNERMLSRPVVMTEPASMGGHTGERQEDALARADLDDEADDVGFGFQPKDDNDIVNLADLVAQRVENTGAGKLSDVDASALGANLNRCNAHPIILG